MVGLGKKESDFNLAELDPNNLADRIFVFHQEQDARRKILEVENLLANQDILNVLPRYDSRSEYIDTLHQSLKVLREREAQCSEFLGRPSKSQKK